MKTKQNLKPVLAAIILGIMAQASLYSQWKPKTLKVAFVSESVSIPFGQVVIDPVHPGLTVGTDLMVKDQTAWYRSFGVEAGYYYHRLYEHAIMLDAAYRFGYTFGFKLRVSVIGMAGYKHSILTGETYVLENGEYKAKKHPGHPQVSPKIGFGLAYPVNSKISITGEYFGMFAIPYSPDQGMPFSTHALLRIGTTIKFH
jgi:hypothetical protein